MKCLMNHLREVTKKVIKERSNELRFNGNHQHDIRRVAGTVDEMKVMIAELGDFLMEANV